jgi:hypothetical protein
MHPFRIAILIFLVGTSIVNVLVTKISHDGIGYPPRMVEAGNWADRLDQPTPKSTPVMEVNPNYDSAMQQHTVVNESATILEVLLITVAGVAWFLVRPRA